MVAVNRPSRPITLFMSAIRLIEAELGFLGAIVPAGEHELCFEYRSRAGCWLPFAAAAQLAALRLIGWSLR